MAMIVSSSAAVRPQSVTTRGLTPALPAFQLRRPAVRVQSRNFKTDESVSTPSSEEINAKLQEYVESAKAKWEKTEEKPAVIAIGAVAFISIWALSGLVDRVDKLPLVGGLLELVGLVVTSWFAYRYLTFAPDREELKKNVDSFFKKVTGK